MRFLSIEELYVRMYKLLPQTADLLAEPTEPTEEPDDNA